MNLPTNFKQIISDTFYDKVVNIYNTTEEIGEELDAMKAKGEIIQKDLKCNVHQIGNEVAKKDYGLDINANIMVTCDNSLANISDILEYNGQDYTITGKLVLDSHTKLFAILGDLNG